MAGKTRWIAYHNVNEHPEESILLAYLRGQDIEGRASVREHLTVEKCPRCLQKLNQLEQVSTTLDILGDMRAYQHYPEVSVAETLVRMQSTVNRRIPAKTALSGAYYQHHPGRSVVRLISVPAAFGLALLLTMAMLVFAHVSGRTLIPFAGGGSTSPGQPMLTVAVPPQSTSTNEASEAQEPHLKVCSTQADIDQLRLVICGFHFESMHKATLVVSVPGKKPMWVRDIPVDTQGEFQIGWKIADCENVPTLIYGYEATRSKPIFVQLHIPSFGRCPAPPPVGRPSGFHNILASKSID